MQKPGVYILQSLKNGRYYVGSTNDVNRRLKEHNKGEESFTRNIRPLKLKTFISCTSLAEARECEYRLKQYKRRDILEKVIKDGAFPWKHVEDS